MASEAAGAGRRGGRGNRGGRGRGRGRATAPCATNRAASRAESQAASAGDSAGPSAAATAGAPKRSARGGRGSARRAKRAPAQAFDSDKGGNCALLSQHAENRPVSNSQRQGLSGPLSIGSSSSQSGTADSVGSPRDTTPAAVRNASKPTGTAGRARNMLPAVHSPELLKRSGSHLDAQGPCSPQGGRACASPAQPEWSPPGFDNCSPLSVDNCTEPAQDPQTGQQTSSAPRIRTFCSAWQSAAAEQQPQSAPPSAEPEWSPPPFDDLPENSPPNWASEQQERCVAACTPAAVSAMSSRGAAHSGHSTESVWASMAELSLTPRSRRGSAAATPVACGAQPADVQMQNTTPVPVDVSPRVGRVGTFEHSRSPSGPDGRGAGGHRERHHGPSDGAAAAHGTASDQACSQRVEGGLQTHWQPDARSEGTSSDKMDHDDDACHGAMIHVAMAATPPAASQTAVRASQDHVDLTLT